jgi:hypothetical protein
MKQRKFFLTASFLFVIVTSSYSQNKKPENASIAGTFVASTPCSEGTRPLPGMAANASCDFIKWNLTLYQDESKQAPTTYKLHYSYGLSKAGTTGFIDGGTSAYMEGTWTIDKGTPANPNATVYQLIDSKTNKTISFIKLTDNLLHLLDGDKQLMIGSAAWSYTLNRTNNK